ncbi:MAG: hypothetical protein EBT57_05625 [Verrucomicrobia bacterium]|nr:hypothetical protein [Verrucomicrobiota bacterium]
MARKRRGCPPGEIFHLCNRAAGGLTLFQNSFDYLQFTQVVREALQKFPVCLYAYCVMPNHWHFLVQARKPGAISRFMHWFGTTHAARYRKSQGTTGRGAVYQNRFRSHPVNGSCAFFKTAAYIERNAASAGLVQEAAAWPWTSAKSPPSLPLTTWHYPKPKNWLRFLADPIDPATLRQLLQSEISGQAFESLKNEKTGV